jgi:hypothetical protein
VKKMTSTKAGTFTLHGNTTAPVPFCSKSIDDSESSYDVKTGTSLSPHPSFFVSSSDKSCLPSFDCRSDVRVASSLTPRRGPRELFCGEDAKVDMSV